MLPALSELKRYILEQSIEGWNSVEHARTVTRTLEAILKVAEVKMGQGDSDSLDQRSTCSVAGRFYGGAGAGSVFGSDEEEEDIITEDEEEEAAAKGQERVDKLITFTATLLGESGAAAAVSPGGYDGDTEHKIMSDSRVCLTDDEGGDGDEGDEEEKFTSSFPHSSLPPSGAQFQLHEGVCQIVMEILFELSKKCVADPLLWCNNLNAVLNHLAVVSRSLGGTEAILRGFAVVLQTNDVRLRELQTSILKLVQNILTPGSLAAFTSLFTAEKPPVELLLPKFYEITVARMEIREPVCELEFPTRGGEKHV